MESITLVFVHGWSVSNVDTYGELPVRLRAEALAQGINMQVTEIFLGKYISFHDEVRLADISRAFMAAVKDQLPGKKKFVCITHSTGGPVIRDWWHRYYPNNSDKCPLSHSIMLAPANYGSALAQLGKGRLGRLKSWFEGVEPGQGVLDWLELGSNDAWNLNKLWIQSDGSKINAQGFFPFVITGQSIDRKLYDNLNTYTGELGSDGVVRVAAANLEGRYIRLEQEKPYIKDKEIKADVLKIGQYKEAPKTPLRIITGKSHSGKEMGILASVKGAAQDDKSAETVNAILDCVQVKSEADYNKIYNRFEEETTTVQKKELAEFEKRLLLTDRYFIHDRFSMVIFKVVDTEGYPVKDYDLLITAGAESDPNLLPTGFFVDRQRNRLSSETITYYVNYNIMHGMEPVLNEKGEEVRPKIEGIKTLGFELRPRPEIGFVHYLPCKINASKELFEKALTPNSTTLIEICLQRIVYQEVFQIDPLTRNQMPTKREGDFKKVKPKSIIDD